MKDLENIIKNVQKIMTNKIEEERQRFSDLASCTTNIEEMIDDQVKLEL